MSPERWKEIENIFQFALDLPQSEREAYLSDKCGNDKELRAEIEKLLSQFEEASDFIERPLYEGSQAGVLSSLMELDDIDPLIGALLGSYRIEKEIGRGGMGAVYQAVRADGEFRMKAAIKVVKRGMDTDFILRRFRNERQILAALEHPFITRLLDGGTTEDGRPYFVMDFIEGLPLYRFCDRKRLSISERLEVFTKVCEAVEYAHEKMVIHRDLKPSNILITKNATPRLLDFGIAKLLDPEMASDTLQPTATALRMMTVDYASPEQVRGEKVTYSSDIYSLGVILYELLTGHRPYRFQSRHPNEMARAICEDQPSLPSQAISRSDYSLPVIQADQEALTIGHLAELRKDTPEKLQEELSGNLDRITIKALRKDPPERYHSIKKFREDIEKHLDGKIVSAPFYFDSGQKKAPPTAPAGKLIAVLPLKLISFEKSETTDENYLSLGLADAIISRLASIRQFTVRPTSSISGYADGEIDPLAAGRELGVEFILDGRIRKFGKRLRISLQLLDVVNGSATWARQFDEDFMDVLALEDAISEQVAEALVPQLTGEDKIKLSKRGTDNPEAYEAYLKGRFYWNQFTADSLPKAIEQFQKAVSLDPNYALAHVGVADFYIWANIYGLIPSMESYRLAESAIKRALEIDDKLGEAWATLGLVQANKFDWDEGKRCHEKAIELNPNYPNAHEWYSASLVGSGNFAEGIKEIERAEALDPLSRRTKTLVAWTKCQAHQFAEALAKAEEIIDLDEHYPQGHLQKGYALIELGRGAEAVAEIERAMSLMPESPLLKFNLAFAFASAGRREDARKVFNEMKADAGKGYIKPMFLGFTAIAAGEIDEAFVYLNQAADEFDPWLVWLGTDLKLEPIRKDKRYLELMKRTKNPMLEQFEEKLSSDEKHSIAVLPFRKIGKSPADETDNDFLGFGLADSIIMRLTKVSGLSVRPTNSVSNFSEIVNPSEAGKQLNVEFVLDGTIRYIKNAVRVSVQLLQVKDSSTIWSHQFDEPAQDILQLEDVISQKVAVALLPQLDTKERLELEKKYSFVPEAYDAYLRGRYFWNKLTPESLFKSLEMFEKAITLDPNFALAYVGIADFHIWLSAIGITRPDESLKKAKAAAEKALEIDPELIEAYCPLASYEFVYEHNQAKGEYLIKKVIDAKPNYWVAYETLAFFNISQLNFEKGIEYARKAEKLTPLSTRSIISTAWCLYLAGKFEDSLIKSKETLELVPNLLQGNLNVANALIQLDKSDEAIPLLEQCLKYSPKWTRVLQTLACAFVATNQREKAEKILADLEKTSMSEYVSPFFIATACVALNEIGKAFEWLEKAYEERSPWLIWLESEAKFESIRDDARFKDLIKRIKLPDQTSEPAFSKKKSEGNKHSVAVLPLQFIGEIPTGDAYLSVGLADAMITRLSQVKRIVVRPTNSVLRFAETQDSFAAGRELGVDYALCGTIRPAGKRIRISAQLIDIKANTTLWSDKFDEDFGEVLALEDLVAEKVAKLLIPQLTAEEEKDLAKRNARNVEAYEAYLRGRYHLNLFTPDNYAKAFEYFQEAIKLDADYALAYASLAEYYFALGTFGNVHPRESYQSAREMAQHAIRLDDKLGEAYSILGFTQLSEFELQKADKTFRRAISLNPNYPMPHIFYSVLLIALGEPDRAVSEAVRAVELNPNAPFEKCHLMWILYQSGLVAEAAKISREIAVDFPEFAHNIGCRGWILRNMGEFDESLEYAKRAVELSPNTTWLIGSLAATYAKLGDREKALELLHEIEKSPATADSSAYPQAIAYAALGDKETAFAKLETAYETRDAWIIWLASDAEAAPLRDDPRYAELVKKINPSAKKPEILGAASEKTIAVLPFQFLGEIETSEAFLSVGLTDAMITRLSGVQRLVVRPTNSVLRFSDSKDSIAVGRELGVDYVLKSTIRVAGDRLRISAQLLDIKANKTLWTEEFDEEFTGILELEDKVSEKVAATLLPNLSEEEKANLNKRLTDNAKAYGAYIRGRHHWNKFTEADLQKSLLAYQEALRHDPNFALAYAGIADFFNFICIFGAKSPRLSFPAAKKAAQKAIELDPNLAEAYVALGVVNLGYDWDFLEAERLFMKGLYLNPNYSVGHYWYAQLLSLNGEHDNAIHEMEIAEKLNPGIPSLIVYHAFVLRNARKFDESLEKLREALAIQPNYYVGIQAFCWIVKWTKNYDEAEELNRLGLEQTNRLSLLLYSYAYILAARGKEAEAREIAHELEKRISENYIPAIYLSLIYTELGEFGLAFKWLEKSFEEREFWAVWLPVDPRYDALKSDKRFAGLCRRIKPLSKAEEAIHQSQIPTKTFTAEELKGTKPEEKKEGPKAEAANSSFFYRHRNKWAAAGVFSILAFVAYLTGILAVKFDNDGRGLTIETDKADASKQKEALLPGTPVFTPNSIVVLPFKAEEVLDNDLGVGLADSLTSKLGAVKRLTVISANTGRAVANDDPQKISGDLGVQYVLKGSILKTDKSYKVFSELYNSQESTKGWKAEFETKPEELFKVINVLSLKVLESMAIEPLPVEKQQLEKTYTANGVAYELYLIGRSNLVSRSPESIRNAISAFSRAKDSDPGFALAYAGLADAYNMQGLYQIPAPPDSYPDAIENAKKALSIDPELAEAHVSLGYSTFFYLRDRTAAELEFRRAIQINPSYAQAHSWFSSFLIATNRVPEAISEVETAKRLDPRALTNGAAMAYFYSKQFGNAIEEVNKALSINSNFLPAIKLKRWACAAHGNYQGAREAYLKERIVNPEGSDAEWYMIEAQVEALNGNKAQILEKLNSSVEARPVKENPNAYAYEIALAYHALGEKEKTFEWLEKAEAAKSYGFNFLEVDHRLEGLRSDPRFQSLLRKLTAAQK